MKMLFRPLLIALLLIPFLCRANTWSGAGVNAFWGTTANWVENAVPTFGGTATFSGNAASIPHPDLNGTARNGISLDFQTAGWTLKDTAGGGTVRVDGNLFIHSLGSGVNHIQCNISSSGSGPVSLEIDSGNTLRFSAGFTIGNLDFGTSEGTLVFDGNGVIGGNTAKNISTPVTILSNGNARWRFHSGEMTAGRLGGTGTIQGYRYLTTTLSGTAVLAPGGNGVFGNEIGTLTFESDSATIRTNLVLGSGATFEVQIGQNPGQHDKLVFNSNGGGRITLQAGVKLNILGEGIPNGTYTLMENLDPAMTDILGTFTTILHNGQPADPAVYTLTYLGDSITLTVVQAAPAVQGTLILLSMGGLFLTLLRKRRRG